MPFIPIASRSANHPSRVHHPGLASSENNMACQPSETRQVSPISELMGFICVHRRPSPQFSFPGVTAPRQSRLSFRKMPFIPIASRSANHPSRVHHPGLASFRKMPFIPSPVVLPTTDPAFNSPDWLRSAKCLSSHRQSFCQPPIPRPPSRIGFVPQNAFHPHRQPFCQPPIPRPTARIGFVPQNAFHPHRQSFCQPPIPRPAITQNLRSRIPHLQTPKFRFAMHSRTFAACPRSRPSPKLDPMMYHKLSSQEIHRHLRPRPPSRRPRVRIAYNPKLSPNNSWTRNARNEFAITALQPSSASCWR